MARDYLETKKTNDCRTRTIVRLCHNYKNIALVKETFDDRTFDDLDYGAVKTVLFYRSISLYQLATIPSNTIIFQLTRTPEKTRF